MKKRGHRNSSGGWEFQYNALAAELVRDGTKERKGITNSDYIQVPSNSQVS